MNDHDLPPTDVKTGQAPELPPIPDGGLAKSMPSWLATPPTRPARFADEPMPLDLASLGESAELPEWLEALSRRVDPGSGAALPVDEEAVVEMPAELPVEPADTPIAVVESTPDESNVVNTIAKPDESIAVVSEAKENAASEPRPIATYLLYGLLVVVIAALIVWLIWG